MKEKQFFRVAQDFKICVRKWNYKLFFAVLYCACLCVYKVDKCMLVFFLNMNLRGWTGYKHSFFLFLGKEVGETVMYFGCRHKNEDYLYQEELEAAETNAAVTQLNVAFSRDQDHKVESTHRFSHLSWDSCRLQLLEYPEL